jgi:phage tail sheath protein FI
MPITPTFPGVYIEEIPSGVRTITGVATSITAFIGSAPRGPEDEPVTVNSFGDYERRFGGLDKSSTMSYAVRDFYLNGGSQAIIVRVTGAGASRATITLPGGGGPLVLEASSPGSWGGNLAASVNYQTKDANDPSPDPDLFNLTVVENVAEGGVAPPPEKYFNVSIDPNDARFLPRVLDQNSTLVRVRQTGANFDIGTARPDATVNPSSPPTSPPSSTEFFVNAVNGSDGGVPGVSDYTGSRLAKTGLFALEKADLFNLLCIPPPERSDGTNPNTDPSVYQEALAYCKERRAFLIVDPPFEWGTPPENAVSDAIAGLGALGLSGTAARNAAIYFPRVVESDPNLDNQLDTFVPCGIVAGVMASTDASRGVWKAPAGLDAAMNGIRGLQVNLTDPENGQLNPLGINCLRSFPVNGRVVWGARTLRGADQLADEYKYVPVRRLALFIEESLYRGTQWVVFEPNDEPLWAQIRLNVGAFMQNLFRQGAFQGQTPREAYLVKCDKETTTQNDINLGIVNILVGFAPLKPAEFVIIKIQQLAGQIAT